MTIVAISGTPATGKTEVARLVGKKLVWKVVELNQLARERGLYSGYDKKRKADVVDLEKIQKALNNIEASNMIIESHYAHEMKCDMVIMLRANPDEIRKRGREKSWGREKVEENVLAEIMEVCKQDALGSGRKVFEVDTTGKTPAKVSGEVVKMIKRFSGLMEKSRRFKAQEKGSKSKGV
jgi:adenylate kinase